MGQKVTGGIRPVEVSCGGVSHGLGSRSPIGPDGGCPARLEALLDLPPVGHEIQLRHAWNPDDRSLNVFVKDDDTLTFHRHPVAQSTDGIRGKVLPLTAVNFITLTQGEGIAFGSVCLSVCLFVCLSAQNFHVFLHDCLSD